jgi:hypothetical protein
MAFSRLARIATHHQEVKSFCFFFFRKRKFFFSEEKKQKTFNSWRRFADPGLGRIVNYVGT